MMLLRPVTINITVLIVHEVRQRVHPKKVLVIARLSHACDIMRNYYVDQHM